MRKYIPILMMLLTITTNTSHARDFENCKILEVVLDSGSNAHIQLDCSISNRPACANTDKYVALNKETESGKQLLSLVLTAFAAKMNISGFVENAENTCPTWQSNVAMLRHLRASN